MKTALVPRATGRVQELPEEMRDLVDRMEPVMRWIFGKNGRTMEQRVQVFLYETNAVGGESLDDIAKRLGVSAQRLHFVVKDFRAAFPAVRSGHRKPAATRAKMRAAHRARRSGAEERREEAGGL